MKNPKLSKQRIGTGNPAYKHGMHKTPEYTAWHDMKGRCLNPNHRSYAYYGGRGITIDESWLEFENFYRDMGPRPSGLTLDRIDNDKGYSKDNCRWANRIVQMGNTRRNNKNVGVSFNNARQDWVVFMRKKYIGRFKKLEDALAARKSAEMEIEDATVQTSDV